MFPEIAHYSIFLNDNFFLSLYWIAFGFGTCCQLCIWEIMIYLFIYSFITPQRQHTLHYKHTLCVIGVVCRRCRKQLRRYRRNQKCNCVTLSNVIFVLYVFLFNPNPDTACRSIWHRFRNKVRVEGSYLTIDGSCFCELETYRQLRQVIWLYSRLYMLK